MFLSVEEFAGKVKVNASRSSEQQRFGPDKVYISDLFDIDNFGLTMPEFKKMLTEANRQGLLRLSRADLVNLMPPEKVRASEATVQNATFHFVRIGK